MFRVRTHPTLSSLLDRPSLLAESITLLLTLTPEVVNGSNALDALPNTLNTLSSLVTQIALLQCLRRLINLVGIARTKDDTILVSLKNTVVRHPSVRQLCLAHTLLLGDLVPVEQRLAHRVVVVELAVQTADSLLVETASACVKIRSRLCKETTSERRVGVEVHAQLPQSREELHLRVAGYGVVVSLIHLGEHVVVLLADVVDFLDLFGGEVGQAETAEDALLVDFVDAVEGLFEGNGCVWGVDVEDIELVNLHAVEGVLAVLDNTFLGDGAGSKATDELGVDGELLALLELSDGDFGAWVEAGRVEVLDVVGKQDVDDFGALLMSPEGCGV
jgi:hypothetical protein